MATICRKCRSDRAHRSRTRSLWERWRKQITGKVLFRCPDCGWRGWAIDTGEVMSGSMIADIPQLPNLRRIGLARDGRADVDLEQLDRSIE
ncbi:MAG TPA: hypothetical protein VKD69_14705 [Vicinamibacterales bacterium]|nr:hypothetical protein [Vicinamibacterales bacterium]